EGTGASQQLVRPCLDRHARIRPGRYSGLLASLLIGLQVEREKSTVKRNLWLWVLTGAFVTPTALADEPAAAHKVLGCDNGHVTVVNAKGEIEWEMPLKFGSAHDVWRLSNGNLLLHTGPATVEEFTPDKKSVWKYTAKPKTANGQVEIHS